MPAFDAVIERLGRPSVSRSRDGLLLRKLDRRIRRAIHFYEVDEVARRLDHRNRIRNAKFTRFGYRGFCDLLRLLDRNRHAEWRGWRRRWLLARGRALLGLCNIQWRCRRDQ